MKKIKVLKGMVIALDKETSKYAIFTKDEWSFGKSYRYPEFDEIETIEEAKELAKNYLD